MNRPARRLTTRGLLHWNPRQMEGSGPEGARGHDEPLAAIGAGSRVAEAANNQIVDAARVWVGYHYRFSTVAGVVLGRDIAKYDLRRAFQPVQ